MHKKGIVALLSAVTIIANIFGGCGGNNEKSFEVPESSDYRSGFLSTSATDDVGRTYFAASPEDGEDKFVGLFYFLTNGTNSGVIDISEYEKRGSLPTMISKPDSGGTKFENVYHYWGKPTYGYYRGQDEWVVRKHIELFVNAGIDFICFDVSNTLIYTEQGYTVLDILLEYYKLGYPVPKVTFLTSATTSESQTTIQNLYDNYYAKQKYADLWFKGKGTKPWVIGEPSNALKNYFYYRPAQWPNQSISLTRKFPWIDWNYPQNTYKDSQVGGIMSVSVSQHVGLIGKYGVSADFSDSGLFAPYNRDSLATAGFDYTEEYMDSVYNANCGRGFDQTTLTNSYERSVAEGTNFESQWKTVFDLNSDSNANNDISLVFITGWNEWMATKQQESRILGNNYGHFVDMFNMEFSRDIELNDIYLDNYYLSMVRNIRKFKGGDESSQTEYSVLPSGTNMFLSENWKSVDAVYKDFAYETIHRRHLESSMERLLINDTGRNDIRETRVAVCDGKLYFLVTTADNITEKSANDTRWMNLFLGVGENAEYCGLNYVLNRKVTEGGKTVLQHINGGTYSDVGECKLFVEGKYMIVEVALSDLGLDETNISFSFKVADNVQEDFDTVDLYTNGDVAPIGRIKYIYKAKSLLK